MTTFPHTCPTCKSPAQHMLNLVLCPNSRCDNYDEKAAEEFWGRFENAAADLTWDDPWEWDRTTLPGLR